MDGRTAEDVGRPRERVRGEVHLLDGAVLVPDDAKQLAALAALGDAPAVLVDRLEVRDVRGPARRRRGAPGSRPPRHENTSSWPSLHQRPSRSATSAGASPPAATAPAAAGERLDRGLRELERERLGLAARARVRQNRRADARLAVDHEAGEVAGHRAAVPDEELVAGARERQPEPPRDRPALRGRPSRHVRHLLERRRREHAVVALREERPPAREVDRRSTTACRGHPSRPCPARARAARRRCTARRSSRARPAPRLGRRPREAERLEHAFTQRLLPGRAALARHDLAEQGEGEVRVVPPRAGRERAALRPRSGQRAPRGSAPAASPRSRPAARAGGRRRARASVPASARARSPG